jgi:hypothetical protein
VLAGAADQIGKDECIKYSKVAKTAIEKVAL